MQAIKLLHRNRGKNNQKLGFRGKTHLLSLYEPRAEVSLRVREEGKMGQNPTRDYGPAQLHCQCAKPCKCSGLQVANGVAISESVHARARHRRGRNLIDRSPSCRPFLRTFL
jgi:hypothetical protein